jgi:HSP20 family protein
MRGARSQKRQGIRGDMNFLRERINKIFEDTMRSTDNIYVTHEGTWSPPIDLYETPSEFIVKAEVPQVRQDDISIRLESNILTIEGERRLEKDKIEYYHRLERPYGWFKRSFMLPGSVDKDAINASLHNGVLRIVLPKREEEKQQNHITITD